MKQLKQILDSLSLRQKISIVAGILVVAAALSALVSWRHENGFKTLYSQLSPEDASAIVVKLKEGAIEYRLENNGSSVLIPSERLAETRLLMAGAGLPKSGRIGFELFDKTNFGVSDFTEHINYRRALEGELERSILSLSDVESARVHITFPKDSVFTEARQPAKASVMISMRQNAKLSPANVSAVTQMVASAVEGLSAQAVSVVDRRGQLLTRKQKGPGDESEYTESLLEYKHQVELDLLTKINHTLQPVLGPDKFQAGVSVECDFTTSEQSEEVLDPSRSVMVNSQKQEETVTNNTGNTTGIPGTTSNLPRPPTKGPGGTSGTSRRTENIAYQSSRSVRHVKTPRGVIKQVSVAVLVDQDVRWEGQGPGAKKVLVPPSPETLKVIQDMVAHVGGVNPERGDRVTVDSLPFEATLRIEPPPDPKSVPSAPTTQQPMSLMDILKGGGAVTGIAVGGLILVALLLYLALRKRRGVVVSTPAELSGVKPVAGLVEAGSTAYDELSDNSPKQLAEPEPPPDPFHELRPSSRTGSRTELLTRYLSEEVEKDAAASAQVLRAWLVQSEES